MVNLIPFLFTRRKFIEKKMRNQYLILKLKLCPLILPKASEKYLKKIPQNYVFGAGF
ncbi:hypothetical protein SAMN04488541_1001216 [Thermoflexibacter ruber]|uniref:Uncharacterized protein n=1 Tax=Thermoflexibacter ruber TaxID=1003 RepID=A0A1I2AKT6_9BACT|nr:hypothetical protein SAMN04488541_1001216 [Thermoflexibacter ruber]